MNTPGVTKSPLPRPPARHVTVKSAETRLAILEGAVDCICDVGCHRMTLTRVADYARVSRGCLKYYYADIESLIADLYPLVTDRVWSSHEDAVRARPAGADPISYAVNMIGMTDVDRYRVARLELLTAARTVPALRAVVAATTRAIEERRTRFVDEIFGVPGISAKANFQAANDMSNVLDDWLQIQPFGADRERRIALVNRALRLSLLMLWRTSPEALENPGKPRVRVAADTTPSRV